MPLNWSLLANLGTDWIHASKLFAASKERQLIQWLLLIDPWLIKIGKNGELPGYPRVYRDNKERLLSSWCFIISFIACLLRTVHRLVSWCIFHFGHSWSKRLFLPKQDFKYSLISPQLLNCFPHNVFLYCPKNTGDTVKRLYHIVTQSHHCETF